MKRKNLWAGIIAGLGVVLAVVIIAYPLISNTLADKNQSLVLTEYSEAVAAIPDNETAAMLTAAQEYNAALVPGTLEPFSQGAILAASQDYYDLLNINEDGMIGFVEIPKLDICLPIYHGTDSETLANGIGHLLGSSLPVGGESTHTILTGHSGMATEKMFTDLDQLQEGDIFYIHILNMTLAYEVDQIKTVLPENTDYLGIDKGADLCTLVTCTPYAVNTHRLLVRGHRVPYEEAAEEAAVEKQDAAPSTWMREYIKCVSICLVLAAVIGAAAIGLTRYGKRGRHESR